MAHEDESQQPHPNTIETWEDPQSNHILPPEIEIEILLRLPVESLLRCKSVCKLWRSLISDPRFVKYHLSLSKSNTEYAHHRLILYDGIMSVQWCHLRDAIYDKSINTFELYYPHEDKTAAIVGSCNGLLCITVNDIDGQEMCIWNPITRRSKWLPYSDFDSDFDASFCPRHGFGYDESSDDYKVVLIEAKCDDAKVMLCSLKSGNGKRIGDFPYGRALGDSSGFLNGALHWIAERKHGSSYSRTIISLDLATETYGEILHPVNNDRYNLLTVGTLGEWLCLACNYLRTPKREVWVMKVYGVKDSWTKLASIQVPIPTNPLQELFLRPHVIANDGKILFRWGKELVLYDAKNGSSSKIKNYGSRVAVWTMVESLVSPDVP